MTVAITGAIVPERTTIANTSVTTVLDLGQSTIVTSIIVCPTSGTPNLSISTYDGTTRRYIRKAVAMTAGTAFVFETPFALARKEKLEVTSSAAGGDMDVSVNYLGGGAGRPGQT